MNRNEIIRRAIQDTIECNGDYSHYASFGHIGNEVVFALVQQLKAMDWQNKWELQEAVREWYEAVMAEGVRIKDESEQAMTFELVWP